MLWENCDDAKEREDFWKMVCESGTAILLGDQDIKNRIKKLIPDFREYQLSVYLHGFSSFLEMMLLGNHDNGYLGSIIRKMEQYSYVQSYLRNGLTNLSENIRMVDRLYNQPTEILFDKDNIYLCQLK